MSGKKESVEKFSHPLNKMATIKIPSFSDSDLDDIIRKIFNEFWDKHSRVKIMKGKKLIHAFDMNYKGTKTSSYEHFRMQFLKDQAYDEAPVLEKGMKVVINIYKKLTAEKMEQAFREGVQHCVFTPLVNLWNKPAKSSSTNKYNQGVLKRIIKISEQYGDKAVPQKEMEGLAKKVETTIKIKDPLGKDYLTYNEGGRKTLVLQNSYLNHVDETAEKKIEREIEHYEAIAYINNNFKQGDMIEGSETDPIRIHTSNEILTIKNPMKPFIQEIHDCIPIDIRFNATQYPEINEFILESRIINSSPLRFQEEYDEHYDLEKAYTQFHLTKYYQGFLGLIHQFRNFTFQPTSKFLKEHIGIYKGKIINPSPLAKILGFEKDQYYILPSPEWEFHRDNKTEFVITQGIYGSSFDFRFPQNSFKSIPLRTYDFNRPEKTTNKPFRIFAGQLSSRVRNTDTKDFLIKTTEIFAKHLKTLYPNTEYDEESEVAKISIEYKVVKTNHHFLSFITSYVRIVMMQEMLKFDISNLSAVTLDGLYFKGKPPKNLIPQFRPKEVEHYPKTSKFWYEPTFNSTEFPPFSIDFNENTFMEGPGGSGKTHRTLTDKGFNNILYVCPTHKLGEDKVEEYGLTRYSTIHKLLGINPQEELIQESFRDLYGEPAVMLVDELTQIEAKHIEKLIKMFSHSLILIAGDVDAEGRHYQCKYSGEIWKPTFPIVQFKEDYRAKTETLKQMKIHLREYMKQDPTPKEIIQYVYSNYPTISKEQAKNQFTESDIWIAGTHKYIKTLEPHKVHTTHSYQGKTIKAPTKLYISIDDLYFDYSMFYTAMSRVENEQQLIIVGK